MHSPAATILPADQAHALLADAGRAHLDFIADAVRQGAGYIAMASGRDGGDPVVISTPAHVRGTIFHVVDEGLGPDAFAARFFDAGLVAKIRASALIALVIGPDRPPDVYAAMAEAALRGEWALIAEVPATEGQGWADFINAYRTRNGRDVLYVYPGQDRERSTVQATRRRAQHDVEALRQSNLPGSAERMSAALAVLGRAIEAENQYEATPARVPI